MMQKELIGKLTDVCKGMPDVPVEDIGCAFATLLTQILIRCAHNYDHAVEGVEVYSQEMRRAVDRHFQRENFHTLQ